MDQSDVRLLIVPPYQRWLDPSSVVGRLPAITKLSSILEAFYGLKEVLQSQVFSRSAGAFDTRIYDYPKNETVFAVVALG